MTEGRSVWLLQMCQDPKNHPFEMTVLGVFENVSDSDLIGWEKVSTTGENWIKTSELKEYFLQKLVMQESPSWLGICGGGQNNV